MCGYAIDIMQESEIESPVKAKRLKYLTTRDQVCPNCVNTIGKCEKIEAKEEDTPLLRVTIDEQEKPKFVEYCRSHGYPVATAYTLTQFKEVR